MEGPKDGYGPESFALLLKVSEEYEGHETTFGEPFASPYGEGAIPILVHLPECELAVYVDANPWTVATEERFLRWLGLLRTSNREELDVDVRGSAEVSERLKFYCTQSPRVLFELAAVPQVKWVDDPDFGPNNVAVLRRLLTEYFDWDVPDDVSGLEVLDNLVATEFLKDGHVLPWTVLMFGSFFGEVLMSLYGGQWKIHGRTTADVTVEIPWAGGSVMEANVFGRVVGLLENGIEDSMSSMTRTIRERIKSQPR
jgi:hypothetical protein